MEGQEPGIGQVHPQQNTLVDRLAAESRLAAVLERLDPRVEGHGGRLVVRPVGDAAMYQDVAGPPPSDVVPDEYIVLLNAPPAQVPILATQLLRGHNAELRYLYTTTLQGFAARMPAQAVAAMKRNPVVRLIEPNRVIQADEVQASPPSWGLDRVLHKQMGFSLGFLKDEPHLFSPNRESFGHPGAGGALGWADPVRRVSIGYVMNRMSWRLRSPRAVALAQAVHRSL